MTETEQAMMQEQLQAINEKLDRLLAWTEKVDKIVKIVWDARPNRTQTPE